MLILDIFAAHAKTKEGKIQVEMAQLSYRSSHLSGMGKALSRLGGGIGTRGPGETKLETDRRTIQKRMSRLRKEISSIKQVRETNRKQRQNNQVPVVSIIGYTNAGKSTLLNRLTKADVLAEDKLFATLDPTTRRCVLPDGKRILFTDTVGFISKLPHQLIDAFRSTLEEAKYADILLHVVDASDIDMEEHMQVVYETLSVLGISGKPIITVFNKSDLIPPQEKFLDQRATKSIKISAKEKENMNALYEALEEFL
jgi:GTP-binding protein HflX